VVRVLCKNLLYDRGRVLLSILAVGAVVALIFALEGFKVGLWRQVGGYTARLPVPPVALQAGVSSTVAAPSNVPYETLGQIGAVPGVRRAYPLTLVRTIFASGSQKSAVTIIGYDGAGGPTGLRAGRRVEKQGEAVIDYGVARIHGLKVGDKIELFARQFEIVGLSRNTSSFLGSYFFLPLSDVTGLISAGEGRGVSVGRVVPNVVLVDLQPGAAALAVRQAIEQAVPAVDVLTPSELSSNDVAFARELMGQAVNLIVGTAYVVGILVIGLTLYASVFERLREHGVIKALGAPNTRLYGYVLAQAAVFVATGYAVGFAASEGIARLVEWSAPQYLLVPWDWQVLVRTGVAAIAMAAIASLVPVRQMAGVDPATVFRQ
jgi:putative ABC transport system permease protein